jgi:hypothetical protein
MVQVSASSSFDTTSTATVRISSGNSAATVTYLLTEADVAFLAANTAYYVHANASNMVFVSVIVGVCARALSLSLCLSLSLPPPLSLSLSLSPDPSSLYAIQIEMWYSSTDQESSTGNFLLLCNNWHVLYNNGIFF